MANQDQNHRGLGLTRALKSVTRILGPTTTSRPRIEGKNHHGIVDCAVYVRGQRMTRNWDYQEAIAVVRRTPHAFLWMGLHEPSADQLADIANAFDLHELPVEDALQGLQRPKIERYGPMTFAALRTVQYIEHSELTETSEIVETGHVMIFLSHSFVITVRHGTHSELGSLRADLEAKPDLLNEGPWAVAHAIYDRIVDSYVETAAEIEKDIDSLEDMVFSRDRQGPIQRIYQLKRELVEFKRSVLPLQRPIVEIISGGIPDVPPELRRYFRDVNDHLARTVDQVQSFDDLLNSILQARLAQVSVDQNDDMRKIAAWAGIAAVWTAVAGIYGMNFKHIPELEWKYGYPAVWVVCILASIVLYRQFRKSGWL
jgi:magnesium transporter